MATLPTSIASKISQDSVYTPSQRIIEIQLGGGQEKRAGRGINSHYDQWTLNIQHLTRTELDEFITFFKSNGYVESWDWQPPEPSNAGVRKWRFISEPTITNIAKVYFVDVEIRQVFDL